MSKIGIGVVTYNRRDYLERCLAKIRAHTKSDYVIVVADDGSQDDTVEFCRSQGIRVVTGPNRGVCWNKNRALFALEALGCDPILLVEDDCLPIEDDWDFHWRVATALYGHVSYAHPKLAQWASSGTGTALDPIVNHKATAQCSSIGGDLLRLVGFFDSRFSGYGVGHAEWTTRIKRAGRGFKIAELEDGAKSKSNLYISGGMIADDAPTFKDNATIQKNEELFARIKSEPIYRHPWHTDAERDDFVAEMEANGINIQRYLRTIAVERQKPDISTLLYGQPVRAAVDGFLRDAEGMAQQGWLTSAAQGIPVYSGEIAPPFSMAATALLKEHVPNYAMVLDLGGSAFSAAWWASHAKLGLAAVTDAAAVGQVRALLGEDAPVAYAADVLGMVEMARQGAVRFDVVSIAGVLVNQSGAFATSVLAAEGIIVVDDSETPKVAAAVGALAASGYRQLKLVGLAVGGTALKTTSILYRSQNVLGL
jgi:glycosyltransferase involved in cell wall biosynthesis